MKSFSNDWYVFSSFQNSAKKGEENRECIKANHCRNWDKSQTKWGTGNFPLV